jgi:hypothetical protein
MDAIRDRLARVRAGLTMVGKGLPISIGLLLAISIVAGVLAFAFLNSAPPTTLTMTSGPDGSAFRQTAEQYRKILAREGVTLKVLPSQGSRDNLARLSDAKAKVDVGFVTGGETAASGVGHLVSLGSLSYQPLMIFYRGKTKTLLSEFKHQRLDVGLEGSGASALAQTLLDANGIKPGDGTQIGHRTPEASIQALLDAKIDALFAMSDSTPTAMMRQLLRDPDIHLFSFVQAEGYTHRITYLNRLVLPRGAIDFGEDIPAEDVSLIAPTVELVARDSLHPALSDLLLEAAREVHGRAGLSLLRVGPQLPVPDVPVLDRQPDRADRRDRRADDHHPGARLQDRAGDLSLARGLAHLSLVRGAAAHRARFVRGAAGHRTLRRLAASPGARRGDGQQAQCAAGLRRPAVRPARPHRRRAREPARALRRELVFPHRLRVVAGRLSHELVEIRDEVGLVEVAQVLCERGP